MCATMTLAAPSAETRRLLRTLLNAAARGGPESREAAVPLTDLLVELGADDLTGKLRANPRHPAWYAHEIERECFARGLLLWEEEPAYQKAVAFQEAMRRVDLNAVPVLTTNRGIERKEQARLLRGLLKRLGVPHVSVTTPRYSMASTVEVGLPHRPDHDRSRWPHEHGDCCRTPGGHSEETRCPACGLNQVAEDKFQALLLVAFPSHDDRSDYQSDYFNNKWSIL